MSDNHGNQYFLLVIDDYSKYMWLEVLRSKDETFSCYKKIQVLAEAKQSCRVSAFRSDRGGRIQLR